MKTLFNVLVLSTILFTASSADVFAMGKRPWSSVQVKCIGHVIENYQNDTSPDFFDRAEVVLRGHANGSYADLKAKIFYTRSSNNDHLLIYDEVKMKHWSNETIVASATYRASPLSCRLSNTICKKQYRAEYDLTNKTLYLEVYWGQPMALIKIACDELLITR
jgi:hypothetical protein